MKMYRALISVPISAKSEREAIERAWKYANTLKYRGWDVTAGHTECVWLTEENRPVYTSPDAEGERISRALWPGERR